MQELVEIKEIRLEYLATDSKDEKDIEKDEHWIEKVPRLSKKKPYMWNRIHTIFVNGKEVYGTPVLIKHKYTGIFDRFVIFVKRLFR